MTTIQIPTIEEIEQERRRRSYARWVESTLPEGWKFPRHFQFLAEVVGDYILKTPNARVLLSLPPQHGKTELFTARLPSRFLQEHKSASVLVTGYNQKFASSQLSKRAREIAFNLGILDAASDGLEQWKTIYDGECLARGVGVPPTGVGIKLGIIDDPYKSKEDAHSEVVRASVKDWHSVSISQRYHPDSRELIIHTRWHEDDLIGSIVAEERAEAELCAKLGKVFTPRYLHINIPAIAEEDDILGREVGEALWPEERPIEFLEQQRKVQGEADFNAIYQGRPSSKAGDLFKIENIPIVEACPDGLPMCRAWDLAASKNGDYSVGLKMAGPDQNGRLYLLDVVRARLDTHERDELIKRTAHQDGIHVKIRIPQDPGAAGKSQAKYTVTQLAGFTVRYARVTGDKVTRSGPVSSQANVGNIVIVKGPWKIGEFLEELRQFPNGKHDDQVDAFSDAYDELGSKPPLHVA